MDVPSDVLLDLAITVPAPSIGSLVSASCKELDNVLIAELPVQRVVVQVFLTNLSALVALIPSQRSVEYVGALIDIWR